MSKKSSKKPLISKKNYMPRIADSTIAEYLKTFGGVEVAGTKWCGKTWSSIAHAKSYVFVEDEADLAGADPSIILQGDAPRVIDEWQCVPKIWDAARRQIDINAGTPGQFILTGSATPAQDAENAPLHSGAGRFGRVRMFPMSLFESGESTGDVSLASLFSHEFSPCVASNDTQELLEYACRGGWPAVVSGKVANFSLMLEQYIDYTCLRSFPKLQLDSDTALRLLRSLARNVSQSATYKTLLADMYGADTSEKFLSQKTLSRYLSVLKQMFVIEEIPGWTPASRSKARLQTKPKRYFADQSIACAALGLSTKKLLSDWQTFGMLFEDMVMRDLMVYSQLLTHFGDHPLMYYHDDSGLECDAIIELSDGRWAGIEIKVSEDKVETACKNLLRLKKKLCENPKAQNSPPEFLAVIVGIGKYARKTEDGIYVIPIRALGP